MKQRYHSWPPTCLEDLTPRCILHQAKLLYTDIKFGRTSLMHQ